MKLVAEWSCPFTELSQPTGLMHLMRVEANLAQRLLRFCQSEQPSYSYFLGTTICQALSARNFFSLIITITLTG